MAGLRSRSTLLVAGFVMLPSSSSLEWSPPFLQTTQCDGYSLSWPGDLLAETLDVVEFDPPRHSAGALRISLAAIEPTNHTQMDFIAATISLHFHSLTPARSRINHVFSVS